MYCLSCVVLCIVCVYIYTELLPPGGYPVAVKYIIYHTSRCLMLVFFKAADLIYISWGLHAYMRSYCLHNEDNIQSSTQVAIMNWVKLKKIPYSTFAHLHMSLAAVPLLITSRQHSQLRDWTTDERPGIIVSYVAGTYINHLIHAGCWSRAPLTQCVRGVPFA